MKFEPNSEQLEFLNSKNRNVLVSASAGSGKTSSMINKIMLLLCEEHVSIDNLLILTFTEAAASEIKQKLFLELSNLIHDSNAFDVTFLKKQLDAINTAEIGTLHSVCKKLIVKYFYEINLSPDFYVLSDKESKYLHDMAINTVFERHILSNDEIFFELYDSYNDKRNDTVLRQMIVNLSTYLSNKINSQNWLENTLNTSYETNLDKNPVCNYILSYAKKIIIPCKYKVEELLSYAKENSFDKYVDFLAIKNQLIDEICNLNTFTQLYKVIFNLQTIKKPTKSKNANVDELDFDEKVDKFNKNLNDFIRKIKEYVIFDNEDDLKKSFKISKLNTQKLVEIEKEVVQTYSSLKQKRNALDFNDLEDKMIELLKIQNIKSILKNNYKFIFFDEYQDINEKQEYILSNIISDNNYYMIGDVKQSIYAFRQSSPQIFVNKFYKFQKDGEKNIVINFNKNYRSDKNILEFNNLVFDKLITEKTIGINYSENSRFESQNEFENCNVDLKIINTSDIDEEDVEKETKEAIVIADTISNLLTRRKKDGEFFTYKDIAIIVRKRGSFVKTICDTLNSLQIPINATIANNLFDTSEINLLVSILKVLSNYKDDISLTVVLKNLFDVNDTELLNIRQSCEEKYFYECIENENLPEKIKIKISKFFTFINDSNIYLANHNIKELIEKILLEYNITIYLKSLPNGYEKVNNINYFLSLLDNSNYQYNLDKFLDYLNYISDQTIMQKIGTNGNAVQIMTIHYSKGLEFPAVIIAGLGKKFTINKDTNDIIINDKFGVGLKSIDVMDRTLQETLVRNACKIDNKKSEMDEEIRLLYVAMTRPKEYLSLIGEYNLDNYKNSKLKDIYNSLNYFDMIFKAIPNTYDSNISNKHTFIMNEKDSSQAYVNIIDINDIISQDKLITSEVYLEEDNIDLTNSLLNKHQNLPNTNSFTIKNNVTNILKEEVDYENINCLPNKLDVSDKLESLDFLKIGTAYHSIMQSLNFDETKEEIQEIIQNLIRSNIISSDIINQVNINEIITAKETLQKYIKSSTKIYKEKQFLLQENYNKFIKNSDNNTKVIIQGVIDLVVVTDDGAYLIDYKTNRTSNEQQLISNYALQLEIYKTAFEKATNIPINKKFLYSFYLGKLIEVI